MNAHEAEPAVGVGGVGVRVGVGVGVRVGVAEGFGVAVAAAVGALVGDTWALGVPPGGSAHTFCVFGPTLHWSGGTHSPKPRD